MTKKPGLFKAQLVAFCTQGNALKNVEGQFASGIFDNLSPSSVDVKQVSVLSVMLASSLSRRINSCSLFGSFYSSSGVCHPKAGVISSYFSPYISTV
jgi:hypothetical protein